LEAQVNKQADAERYRIQTEAEATRFRTEAEARGQADATRAKGLAQAEIIRATGQAEAEIIALKGASEAEAMRKKADAWKEYNDAAVAQMVITALPEIAKAIAEPLTKVDKISIISTDGKGGASRLTGDVANVLAQLPEIVKTLSGLDLNAILGKVCTPEKK
jgi:flotillin